MKNILLCMLAVVLAAFAGVGNAEALTFSEFRTQTDEAFKGTMTPDQFLKLSNQVLAKDVGEDAEFKAYVHAARGHAYWLKKDYKKSQAEAELSLAANPKSPFGRLILIDAFKGQNQIDKAIEQADLLVETAEKPEHKEAYANLAAQMRAESTAITPSVLWQAFDDNEVAAEDTYKGKTLAVKGTIHAITTSPLGAPQVTFAVDKHAINRVVFEFAKDDRPQVGKLKKGQQVLLSGRCKGMTLKSVFLDEAKVIE